MRLLRFPGSSLSYRVILGHHEKDNQCVQNQGDNRSRLGITGFHLKMKI